MSFYNSLSTVERSFTPMKVRLSPEKHKTSSARNITPATRGLPVTLDMLFNERPPKSSSGRPPRRKPVSKKLRPSLFERKELKPTTVLSSYHEKSQSGLGQHKCNQDSILSLPQLGANPQISFFCVCDGHGQFGEKVSQAIIDCLPRALLADKNLYNSPRRALFTSIIKTNSLISYSPIDISLSGSTLVSVMIRGSTLWCANVGDSRAIIGSLSEEGWVSKALSRDHKLEMRDEQTRVRLCGADIYANKDVQGNQFGPLRVWGKNQRQPGLAMSRSIGDGFAKTLGVICDPEIFEYHVQRQDKFIVIGSDGLFEYFNNEEVVKIAKDYWNINDPKAACDALVREATKRWMQIEGGSDDISCIFIILA